MAEYPEQIAVGSPPYQVTYVIQPGEILLRFTDFPGEEADAIVQEFGLEIRPATAMGGTVDPLREGGMRWAVAPNGGNARDAVSDLLDAFPGQVAASPVYHAEGQGLESAASPLPDTVVALLAPSTEDTAIEIITGELGLDDHPAMSALLAPFHLFSLSPAHREEGLEAVDLIGEIAGVPGVERVELDWIKLRTWLFVPNDTYWGDQWDMRRIGADAAWDAGTGAADTRLAVIDWGFDLAHPDLTWTPNAAPELTHFNAAECWAEFPPPYQASGSGTHAMPVTGIAAATVDNAAGIAGIAGGCPVMPVHLQEPVPPTSYIAAGIQWATDHGARVANLSLTCVGTDALQLAVERAWAAGVVLCAASGNDAGAAGSPPVGFPAAYASVIAVGAIDLEDQRQQPGGIPDEGWGSHFGPELAVVAPGVNCWTTDRRGRAGANANNGGPMVWGALEYGSSGDPAGEYFALFSGTSAATPHVSGLAALIRSTWPSLTSQQVRDVIERTCDKVRPDLYAYAADPAHPNGTWHPEAGHGRINGGAAMREAATIASAGSARHAFFARRVGPRPRVRPS